MNNHAVFKSRLGFLLSALGMAIGTGNIWRFPRIIAQNGGGTFLIPWIIFLFLWSIPLLILEFGMGKTARKGTVGAFGIVMGKKFGWMGAYVGFCTMAIMFYYSVVTGWCLKYFIASVSGDVFIQDGAAYWNTFVATKYQPLLFHFFAIFIGSCIVFKGISGIEKANKFLIPSLFLLVIVAVVRALLLPGAVEGLNFLFTPSWSQLLNHRIWLEALTQSAWSTGAGWGLILTYAIYSKKNEDIVLNSSIIGLGNNSVSLLAAMAVIPIVFAFKPEEASQLMLEHGPASTGLTFVWIPQLFARMVGARFFLSLFFLALCFAAISSLIALFELVTRVFMDIGLARTKAIILVGSVSFILGAPSAVSMAIFENQDWVWGVGLLVSGFFIAVAAIKYGVKRFREDIVNHEGNDIRIGRFFDFLVFLIPVQFFVLLWWWFSQAGGWTDIFSSYSVGTCLFQWGIAVILFLSINKWLIRRTLGGASS